MGANLKKFLFSAIYYFYSSLFVECIWFLIGYSLFCRKWEWGYSISLVSVGLQLRFESQLSIGNFGLGLF
jgi:hypothetical protein